MASVTKLSSGNYRARVLVGREDGKQKFISATAKTSKAAIKAANALAEEYNVKMAHSKVTLGEAMDKFIDSKTSILSPASIATYRSLRNNAYDDIIDSNISDLTIESIQLCIANYAVNHTPKSVRNINGFLSSVLSTARPDLDLSVIALPKKVKKQITIPSDEDVELLLSNVKETALYIPVLMASELGMRRGEICAVTWDDIDFNKQFININKAMVRDEFGTYVIKSTKTYESTRIIRLTKNLVDVLTNKQGTDGKARIVGLTPNELSDRFASVINRIGVKHFSFHSLRHYNASVMLKLGMPDKYVMERGGWSNTTIMKDVYQHTFADQKDKYAEQISDYFSKKNGGE